MIQSTSDEAPGLLAYVEQDLEAHHAPDWFHGQPALVKAVSGPIATKERAAQKAVSAATEQLARLQSDPHSAGEEPAPRRPGRAPQDLRCLEQAAHALATARRERARLAEQRAQVQASLRGIGHADHFVDLERGVRRNGRLIAPDIQGHIEPIRAIARPAGLRQSCGERLEKVERVGPERQTTRAFVSRYGGQQVAQLGLTPPVSCVMHAKLIPASSLDRVAQTRPLSAGAPRRERAERLRAPLFAPGGALSAWSPETHNHLHDEAKRLAVVCQRSRANVEGRNGYVSLRSHQLRGRDLPRKRECCTTLHNFFLTRPDGTTAAERFVGQKPRSMFAASVDTWHWRLRL